MTVQPVSILAFDTSTVCCSVALIVRGSLTGEDSRSGSGNYSALLLRMIDRLLLDAGLGLHELDAVAVAQGPGSFTGLRVGISTAQGLGCALGTPLITVSTLEILALQNMFGVGTVCPMIDARRGQVYTCLFECGGNARMAAACPEQVVCPKQWAASLRGPVLFCGSGAQAYQDVIARACTAEHTFAPELSARPRAAMLARIAVCRLAAGDGAAAAQALPSYVRRPDAERAAAHTGEA